MKLVQDTIIREDKNIPGILKCEFNFLTILFKGFSY